MMFPLCFTAQCYNFLYQVCEVDMTTEKFGLVFLGVFLRITLVTQVVGK